jgi:hypothetical protein
VDAGGGCALRASPGRDRVHPAEAGVGPSITCCATTWPPPGLPSRPRVLRWPNRSATRVGVCSPPSPSRAGSSWVSTSPATGPRRSRAERTASATQLAPANDCQWANVVALRTTWIEAFQMSGVTAVESLPFRALPEDRTGARRYAVPGGVESWDGSTGITAWGGAGVMRLSPARHARPHIQRRLGRPRQRGPPVRAS